jgi:drug/metabolite transporter (DMT)-like permease
MKVGFILLFIILIVIAESFSQHYIKKGSQFSDYRYLILAIFFYSFVIYFLYILYQEYRMGPIFLLWSIMSTISIYILGHILYKEQITSRDILGSLLCFIGLYIVYKDTNHLR